jgi:hypothetical protein
MDLPKDFQGMLLIAANKAFLGRITTNIRMISLDWDSENIVLHAYIDGDVSEEIKKEFEIAGEEIMKRLPFSLKMNVEVMPKRFPEKISFAGHLVYSRKELA